MFKEIKTTVDEMEMYGRCKEARQGDNILILFKNLTIQDIQRGDIIIKKEAKP